MMQASFDRSANTAAEASERRGPVLAEPGFQVFAINPRSTTEASYWPDIQANISLCARHGATGVLCFSGNDTQVDPWLVANEVASVRRADGEPLVPLVALNPNTMPPYTAAKMITSLEAIRGGRVALNLITGASNRDREVLGDTLSHDERYDRLLEYATLVDRLLTDRKPVSFQGRYFRLHQAALLPRSRQPRGCAYFLAGHSAGANRVADALGAVQLKMVTEGLAQDLAEGSGAAIHFGLISRADREAAWLAAHERFPADPSGEAILQMTMRYTDSEWKQALHARLKAPASDNGPYWLGPFRNFQSDCPFLVGSTDELAEVLCAFMEKGVRNFVLDLPPDPTEFSEAAAVFAAAYARHDFHA